MSSLHSLLAVLADGHPRSASRLAADLGITIEELERSVEELRALGVDVVSDASDELQLVESVELLDAGMIGDVIGQHGALPEFDLDVLFTTGSTNELLFTDGSPARRPRVVFAEIQQAGRGRRGRSWIAPFGSGLTFSIGWNFAQPPRDLPALSLVIGIEVARVLHDAGAAEVRVKWPNDLVCRGRKLGGILTQLRSEPAGPAFVVTGLGLNLRLPQAALESIERDLAGTPGDLRTVLGMNLPGRNELAGRLVARMLAGLAEFAAHGFAAFAADWQRCDALESAPVRVAQFDGHLDGTARGVDRDGALLVEIDGRMQRFVSGEVTVRARSREVA